MGDDSGDILDQINAEMLKSLYEMMDLDIFSSCPHDWDKFDKVVAEELKLVKYCTKCGKVKKT